jgi:hypothetical protein
VLEPVLSVAIQIERQGLQEAIVPCRLRSSKPECTSQFGARLRDRVTAMRSASKVLHIAAKAAGKCRIVIRKSLLV